MEDPWANAWGDSSKPVPPETSPLWAAPSVSVLHADNEDDLSIPAWPKGSVSGWSAEDLPADHIWSTTQISSTWDPSTSTFDEISLAGGHTAQTETQDARSLSSSLSLHEEEAWAHPKTQLQELQSQTVPPEPIPSETLETVNVSTTVKPGTEDEVGCRPSPQILLLQKSTSALSSEDVDGFGSFETGEEKQDKESWTPTNSVFPLSSTDTGNWDSAWQVESEDGNKGREDAWEAARRQKEERDRHVARHSCLCFRVCWLSNNSSSLQNYLPPYCDNLKSSRMTYGKTRLVQIFMVTWILRCLVCELVQYFTPLILTQSSLKKSCFDKVVT
jgi:hypothetical protein